MCRIKIGVTYACALCAGVQLLVSTKHTPALNKSQQYCAWHFVHRQFAIWDEMVEDILLTICAIAKWLRATNESNKLIFIIAKMSVPILMRCAEVYCDEDRITVIQSAHGCHEHLPREFMMMMVPEHFDVPFFQGISNLMPPISRSHAFDKSFFMEHSFSVYCEEEPFLP